MQGMLHKRGTRTKKKGDKRENWKFNEVTVWDRIQLSFCSHNRISRKLGQNSPMLKENARKG